MSWRTITESVVISFFDLLPKKLVIRSFFIYWGCLPYIIIKFAGRALRRKRKMMEPSKGSRSITSDTLNKLSAIPERSQELEICVRYSGGTDSTKVAFYMAQHFRKVHLITFAASYQGITLGTIRSNPKNSLTNIRHLHDTFGQEKFIHRIIPVEDLRDSIYFGPYQKIVRSKDFLRVSFCPACTVAMHVITIEYCRKHAVLILRYQNLLITQHE